ncbi:MAG: flagellar hook-associated protein FlgK [Burkholderiaceae bacterium]|nr:flagellar hook-associated protein FlgK [Burkholderiaceae bacterium]
MSLGMRAMAANYAALQVAGHNIANAGVAGYSRQRVELATAQGQFSGAGYFGKGSDVVTVSRYQNEFLTREAMNTRALAARDDARLNQLRQLEQVFPLGESGLGNATNQLLNAFSDLANLPADMSSRQVVLARARDMAVQFANAGQQLDRIQSTLREDLKATLATVNELTSGIASLNQQIASVRGLGQPPNDLLDARDRMLSELAEQVAITTVQSDDGTVAVFAGGGQSLVLGTRAQTLSVMNDPGDPSRAALGVSAGGQMMRLDTQTLGGGRVAGLLQFQNEDLVDAGLLVGQMAAAVAGAVNAQQRLGLNLHQPAGSVAAQAMFAVGAGAVVASDSNARDSQGRPIGQLSLTVVEPSQLQASEYTLRNDPIAPGSFVLTRLSDGLERSVAAGEVVDGFQVDPGVPAPLSADKFLLQPVTYAARGMAMLLSDPRDIAAASPLTATMGPANTGTAQVGALTITGDSVNPAQSTSITFTDDSGAYSWELRDRITNALVSSGTGTWSAGSPIPASGGTDINGFALTLTGVPRAGDVVNIAATTNVAANSGNAAAIAALREQRIVGLAVQPDGSIIGGATATDTYAAAMADIGVRVQGADAIVEISTAMASQADVARSSEVGVNLDEEAAMLIHYQQSYQAAAKVLQIAQSIFDTLLQTTA